MDSGEAENVDKYVTELRLFVSPQCAALTGVLPPPAAASNGGAMDTDDVEDVSLRHIGDMAAENQRRCP